VVNATGNLFLSNVQVTNEDLTINSANPGGAFNASGASIWTGDIVLSTDTFIASSGSLLLLGQITAPAALPRSPPGQQRSPARMPTPTPHDDGERRHAAPG